MSKRQFKSQASSGRAAFGGGSSFGGSFGASAFGSSSPLSWITEPPELSAISDPNVAVSFKNLSKKDSTTKAKALEDLQTYITSPDHQVEEAVLEAWVKLYPRLSIDSARRVRFLAHTLLGQVATNCGKRIARHMPKLAGPWLAGTQDSDRAAARAAQDALKQVFGTPEKLRNVGKAFQQPILEYCRDALLNETIQTLSDERAVSPDDAEATYSRVVATSVAVISNLLKDLPTEETGKQQATYDAIIAENKIWEFAAYRDVGVRRYVHRLLRVCVSKQRAAVEANLTIISKAYIDKALHADQTGSSYDLMQALVDLTAIFPQVWTSNYKGKKAAGERLRQALKKGSQAGSSDFWTTVKSLLTQLPTEVLPKEPEEMKKFLISVQSGVALKEERFNASAAWDTYFSAVGLVLTQSTIPKEESERLTEELVLPIIDQYLKPSETTSPWTISGAKAALIVSQAARVSGAHALLERKWPEYADRLIHDLKTSAPEQSKDFDKSQTSIAQSGERWALLQAEFLKKQSAIPESLHDVFVTTTRNIIQESLQLLKTRNGKPYGSAAIVDEMLNHCSEIVIKDQEAHSIISAFILEDLPDLLYSPSQRQLFSLLYHYQKNANFTEAWNKVASSLANGADSPEKLNAFRTLLSSPRVQPVAGLAAQNSEIQKFLQRQYLSSISSGEGWAFLADVLRSTASVASPETTDLILADLTSSLTISDKARMALDGLDSISGGNRVVLKDYVSKPNGSQLLPNLLHLEESPEDTIAQKASVVSKRIVDHADKSSSQSILFDVVHQSLNKVSSESLPITTVLDMAQKLVHESGTEGGKANVAKQALPDLQQWEQSLLPYLSSSPIPAQAITGLTGGAVYLVQPVDDAHKILISRDAEGYSQALRFAAYVARTCFTSEILEGLDAESKTTLFRLLYLTFILIQSGNNPRDPLALVAGLDSDLELPLSKLRADFAHVLSECTFQYQAGPNAAIYDFVGAAMDEFYGASRQSGPTSYINAEALSHTLADVHSAHGNGHEAVKAYQDNALQSYKSREVLALTAIASGLGDAIASNKALDRQANEIVADLTGLDAAKSQQRALEQLIMLNALLPDLDAGSIVAKQRLIFLVKHILTWPEQSAVPAEIIAETFKLLCVVLPAISDIYGEHWTQVLSFITHSWKVGFVDAERGSIDYIALVVLYNTLRLLGTLRKLQSSDDPNDDLVDAMKEYEDAAHDGLINLLKSSNRVPDADTYLPLELTFDLLAQEIDRSPRSTVEDPSEIYSLIYAESRSLQKVAFNILHAHIPSVQEQISFDAALENKSAKLPEELLSLILETPKGEIFDDSPHAIPRDLQGYLYSWQLVFDHFSNASYKVKSDYIENLKDGDHLPDLLNLTYDFLGHSRGRPVDVSKYDITRYDYAEKDDMSETELSAEKRLQWLLAHLFYQALLHLPSLTKAHYLSVKARQTSLAVESWTAKYIAPLIINASLSSVADWAATSAKDDPEFENFNVKVSMRSREVNVSYLVDEQTMAIVVRLPEDYPLTGAKVEGVNRVAVGEQKWQSWLRNCQGVITFSNGNLIDGLSTWRKNVTGALKGQTECAICYSIISGDKQLPSKRCSTCKNLFHSSCLFKWFKTSNASSCPLCRNPFNYG